MGGGAKALQTIARRILAQVFSASACERNWSMYSYVHNKSRNRLKHSHVEDLVYIYTNSRFIRQRRDPKPAQWYELNEVHSDDDLDENDNEDEGIEELVLFITALDIFHLHSFIHFSFCSSQSFVPKLVLLPKYHLARCLHTSHIPSLVHL